jgi:excisionase family DNA binding protein
MTCVDGLLGGGVASAHVLTSRQVAEILGYQDASQIRRLAEAGHLRGTKVGRDWLFDLEEVERFRLQPPIPRRKRAPKRQAEKEHDDGEDSRQSGC